MKVVAYCDGAAGPVPPGSSRRYPRNPGPSGIGFAIYEAGSDGRTPQGKPIARVFKHIGHGSNNRAELDAVSRALRRALNLGGTHVVVYTDSQIVVGWIKRGGTPLYPEISERIRKRMAQFKTCDVEWIRAKSCPEHVLADELATKAALQR